jgi:hypothetical protein
MLQQFGDVVRTVERSQTIRRRRHTRKSALAAIAALVVWAAGVWLWRVQGDQAGALLLMLVGSAFSVLPGVRSVEEVYARPEDQRQMRALRILQAVHICGNLAGLGLLLWLLWRPGEHAVFLGVAMLALLALCVIGNVVIEHAYQKLFRQFGTPGA